MMTTGRLRAIEVYLGTHQEADRHPGVLSKHVGELIAEVKRLRGVIEDIAIEAAGVDARSIRDDATDALREPDLGPPDIVCRRGEVKL